MDADAVWAQRTASLAQRFEAVSEDDASRALQAVDGHAGHAAKLLQQQLAQSVLGPGSQNDSAMSQPGSHSFLPPPSPMLAGGQSPPLPLTVEHGASGDDWRLSSPERSGALGAQPILSAMLAGGGGGSLGGSLGGALKGYTSPRSSASGARDLQRRSPDPSGSLPAPVSVSSAASSAPTSPPSAAAGFEPVTQPRSGAMGELGAAAATANAGPSSFQAGAEAGDADAQFNLGACYADAIGCAKDMSSAVAWWRRAAEAEHASALHALSQCYRDGLGVAVDLATAEACVRAAAAVRCFV